MPTCRTCKHLTPSRFAPDLEEGKCRITDELVRCTPPSRVVVPDADQPRNCEHWKFMHDDDVELPPMKSPPSPLPMSTSNDGRAEEALHLARVSHMRFKTVSMQHFHEELLPQLSSEVRRILLHHRAAGALSIFVVPSYGEDDV